MLRIVTDSTANLPDDFVAEHGIAVVPLRVIFPDATYRDGIDITAAQFYRKLAASPTLPTTSQPPAIEFEQAYESVIAGGDDVLAITISESLSGTFASAVTAQKAFPAGRVTVFDSRVTSAPLAFMVTVAARMARDGVALPEILRVAAVMRDRCQIYFVLDTLEYLQKGGRIGGAAALAGSLLKIKPILTLRNGRVEPWGKARGKRRAMQGAMEAAVVAVGEGPSVRAAVVHASAPEAADAFRQEIAPTLRCPLPEIYEFSPTIGVHLGPQALAVAVYNTEWLVEKP
jgi:DegV family protein with EDD domain